MWPLSAIKAAREAKRLRQECLDEILKEAEKQGIKFARFFLDDKDPSKAAKSVIQEYPYFTIRIRPKDPSKNATRIALEELKKLGVNYSIEFFLQEHHYKKVRTHPGWDEYETVRTPPLPEGYITSYIGEVLNPKFKAYMQQRDSIREEIREKKKKDYQQRREEWEEVLMDEWEYCSVNDNEIDEIVKERNIERPTTYSFFVYVKISPKN